MGGCAHRWSLGARLDHCGATHLALLLLHHTPAPRFLTCCRITAACAGRSRRREVASDIQSGYPVIDRRWQPVLVSAKLRSWRSLPFPGGRTPLGACREDGCPPRTPSRLRFCPRQRPSAEGDLGSPVSEKSDPRFLVQILSRPVWLAGAGLQASGWVLEAAALDRDRYWSCSRSPR